MIGPAVDQSDQNARRTSEVVRWANPLLKAFKKAGPPLSIARRVPDGSRVYCVGDIHGRDDLLQEMAERVAADLKASPCDHAVTVFLGDYVDRGLGSLRVVERLARGVWPSSMIKVARNHEDLLLAFLENEEVLAAWRRLGGLETLHSYGVNVRLAMGGRDFRAVQADFAAVFPEHHLLFFETLKVSTV